VHVIHVRNYASYRVILESLVSVIRRNLAVRRAGSVTSESRCCMSSVCGGCSGLLVDSSTLIGSVVVRALKTSRVRLPAGALPGSGS